MKIYLREKREEIGYSIFDVAKLSGISTGALSNYENGKREITLKKVEILAKVYHCKMTDLFDSDYK